MILFFYKSVIYCSSEVLFTLKHLIDYPFLSLLFILKLIYILFLSNINIPLKSHFTILEIEYITLIFQKVFYFNFKVFLIFNSIF